MPCVAHWGLERNNPYTCFLGQGLGIQQETSVWVGLPKLHSGILETIVFVFVCKGKIFQSIVMASVMCLCSSMQEETQHTQTCHFSCNIQCYSRVKVYMSYMGR